MIRVAVVGAGGRMGREILRALTPDQGFEIVAAVGRTDVGRNCRDLAGPMVPDLTVTEQLNADSADVVVDVTNFRSAVAHAEIAANAGAGFVIGATGLGADDLEYLRGVCRDRGVGGMYVPNFAIGAVLMMKFSELAARWIPDVEVIEMHHERKEDAPSGTAMLTAELISRARTADRTPLPNPMLKVDGARGGEAFGVPVHAVRLPGLLAHQQVIFGSTGESLTLRHDSLDRTCFMPGVKLCVRRVTESSEFIVGLDKILFPE